MPFTPIVQKLDDYLKKDKAFSNAFRISFNLAYATKTKELMIYNIHTVDDLTEHNVPAIQPRCHNCGDEELLQSRDDMN